MAKTYLTAAELAQRLGCHSTSVRRRAPARVRIAQRRGYLAGDVRRWPTVADPSWEEEAYLSSFEVAECKGVAVSTVFRAEQRGDLRAAIRVGSTLGFAVDTVDAWRPESS